MSANLLTLNSSKTEFLIIGLKQQLSKIDNIRSIPLILHATLVLSLMNTLPSLIRSHHFLSPAILISDNSAVSVLTSILKQPVPLLPLLSTPNLTTVTLSTARLQQIQNCLARTVVKTPKSSLVTPILTDLHWLKINERIEYKLLSLTYKVLAASQPDYLHNLISVQSPGRTRSSSIVSFLSPYVDHLYLRHYKSPTAPRYASPHLWNPSTSLRSLSFWFHLILRISPHHSHHLRSHYLSLIRPFTPDLKLISFTNLFLHSQAARSCQCLQVAAGLLVRLSGTTLNRDGGPQSPLGHIDCRRPRRPVDANATRLVCRI